MKKNTSFIGGIVLATMVIALPLFSKTASAEPLPTPYDYTLGQDTITVTGGPRDTDGTASDVPADGLDQTVPPPPPCTAGQLGCLPPQPTTSTTATSATSATGATPQSSAASLSQCSAIKFVSLLDIMVWIKCVIVVVIIPMLFVLAFLFFLWGVLRFMQASDSIKKGESKKVLVAGLIGLFVMTSVWGIIKILGNTLGIESTVPLLQTECLTSNGCTPTAH